MSPPPEPLPHPPPSSASKIPRRRPSSHAVLPPDPQGHRSVSLPPSTPNSPIAKSHARRSSRSNIPAPLPHTPPLQDRRRPSAGALGAGPRPDMKRTPSLSIVIPTAAPSSSSSSAAPHPHVRLPPETDDPRPSVPRSARGAAAARPSPTSASSGAPPHSPWTPRTRRASQPVPGAGAGAGGGGGASPWSTRPPRTPYPKRPAMAERTPSASTMATYTSFDLQAPRTPAEERERRDAELRRSERGWRWCGRWLSGRGRDDDDEYADNEFRAGDEEEQRGAAAPAETTALLENRASGRKEGQTRTQYILAETWCYAKHMLPPILFFVVLVLVVALAAYRQAVSRIIHPPHP